MKRRTQLRRKAPLTRRPPTRSRHTPAKIRPVPRPRFDGEFWQEQRTILGFRAGFRCERCGCDLNRSGMEAHHRKLRSQGGGHDIRNLVGICPKCHETVHKNPMEARLGGWIVPSTNDPFIRPITLHDGRTVLLTEGGGYDVVFDDREGESA